MQLKNVMMTHFLKNLVEEKIHLNVAATPYV